MDQISVGFAPSFGDFAQRRGDILGFLARVGKHNTPFALHAFIDVFITRIDFGERGFVVIRREQRPRRSVFVIRRSVSAIRRSVSAVRRSVSVIHHSVFAVRRSVSVIRRSAPRHIMRRIFTGIRDALVFAYTGCRFVVRKLRRIVVISGQYITFGTVC